MAFTFMKTGKASADLATKHQKEQELRKQEQGKMFRFWMKENEEARITFVDGDLGPDGYLTPPRYYEHNLFQAGKWNNFYVCPKMTNPDSKDECPICESGDRPSLVALFTVIDHRQVTSKDKTKVYKDTKRLLVAKPGTFELLNKHAMKRKGLTGATFEASRVGDKSASVGSMFEFVEKKPVEELKALYMTEKIDPKTNVKSKVTNFTPADYEHEITYRTAEELAVAVGSATAPTGNGEAAPDYANEL